MLEVMKKEGHKVKIVLATTHEPRQAMLHVVTLYESNNKGIIDLKALDKWVYHKREDAIKTYKSLIDGFERNGYTRDKE